MTAYTYPARFQPKSKGRYSVEFPDLPGCATWGEDLEEAKAMAREALSFFLYCLQEEGKTLPPASDLASLKAEGGILVFQVEGQPELARETAVFVSDADLALPRGRRCHGAFGGRR